MLSSVCLNSVYVSSNGLLICDIGGLQADETYDIPLPPGDKWPHDHMNLPHTKPDDTLHPSDIKCPGYKNTNTPWWDASQIYGSSEAVTQDLRTMHEDGKLVLTDG